MMAIVDALTGKVYSLPLAKGLIVPWLDGGPWQASVEFRLDSELVVMTPCPNMFEAHMATVPLFRHYFLWRDNRWTLLKKLPLEPEQKEP